MRKSLNVQEQIAVARDDIRQEAVAWRANPIRACVREVFTARGIDTEKGIFISASDREYGFDSVEGMFITAAGRLIEFEIALSLDGETVDYVGAFDDVTDQQDICGRKRGIGATRSFLILEVLRELNQNCENGSQQADVW